MFIRGIPIGKKQQEQLKPLLDKQVHLEELIIDGTPEEMHYIFAHHLGKTQHFYITDVADEKQSRFICDSIWDSIQ
ncbi:hypothetical protein ACPX19_12490 [Winogradskyella sp. HB-48]|uniref:hypothetical protein n=1 Tax=Winogradskyella sp. HB-48 TaxID=3416808 RepID=UPI003CF6F40F